MNQCSLQQYGWIERLSDEVKLSQKERQIPYDTTYMLILKYDTNELSCKTEDSQTEHKLITKGKEGWEGINQKFGMNKLLYIKQIKNKALLYSTENCIQYPVINHNGKESKKEDIYVSHLAVHQKLAQHCKPSILNYKKVTDLGINFDSLTYRPHIPGKITYLVRLNIIHAENDDSITLWHRW